MFWMQLAKVCHSWENNTPFGGVTVAFRFIQLPPILPNDDKEVYFKEYSTHYFLG